MAGGIDRGREAFTGLVTEHEELRAQHTVEGPMIRP